MGIKNLNQAALLHFANVIGPNCSNSDSETSHFAGVVMLQTFFLTYCEKYFCAPVHQVTLLLHSLATVKVGFRAWDSSCGCGWHVTAFPLPDTGLWTINMAIHKLCFYATTFILKL